MYFLFVFVLKRENVFPFLPFCFLKVHFFQPSQVVVNTRSHAHTYVRTPFGKVWGGEMCGGLDFGFFWCILAVNQPQVRVGARSYAPQHARTHLGTVAPALLLNTYIYNKLKRDLIYFKRGLKSKRCN